MEDQGSADNLDPRWKVEATDGEVLLALMILEDGGEEWITLSISPTEARTVANSLVEAAGTVDTVSD